MEEIILLGIGGHAHSVVDSIEHAGKYKIIGFLDKKEMQGECFRDYTVLGTDGVLKEYYDNGVRNAFVTIGFMGHGNIRNQLYKRLKSIGYTIPNIIDSTATVSRYAKLEEGIFIGKKAVVNSNARIGRMCIVNTGAIVEHDCIVGEFSHIAVGSVMCGGVSVGSQTLVGANTTVIQSINIGSNVILGAGTVICKDIEDNVIRYGSVEKKRNTEG